MRITELVQIESSQKYGEKNFILVQTNNLANVTFLMSKVTFYFIFTFCHVEAIGEEIEDLRTLFYI